MRAGLCKALLWICGACYLHVLAERQSRGIVGVLNTDEEARSNRSKHNGGQFGGANTMPEWHQRDDEWNDKGNDERRDEFNDEWNAASGGCPSAASQ
eukprot:symbB.v1.2.032122.t1/scaffold3796.1/size50198/2